MCLSVADGRPTVNVNIHVDRRNAKSIIQDVGTNDVGIMFEYTTIMRSKIPLLGLL